MHSPGKLVSRNFVNTAPAYTLAYAYAYDCAYVLMKISLNVQSNQSLSTYLTTLQSTAVMNTKASVPDKALHQNCPQRTAESGICVTQPAV